MRNQPHKLTGADIARLAGVSRSTVSRVINGYPNVPEETRRRVLAVIEQHGYYPSASGQMLRGKRARCLGVFMMETGWHAQTQATMLYAFSRQAQAMGYTTLSGILGAFDTPDCTRLVREMLSSGIVDAGVFLNAHGGGGLIRQLLREGQTIGALGRLPDTQEEERLFTAWFKEEITHKAVEYALSLGHRRIALLCDPHSHTDAEHIRGLFQRSGKAAGTDIACAGETLAAVEKQAGEMIDATAKPMLLMCADSASVMAAYRAAYSRGLCVGADVSILGVGMIPPDLPLWPTLTGFVFDTDEVITSLAARLIHGLEGAPNPQRHSLTDYRWLPGDSCAQYAP